MATRTTHHPPAVMNTAEVPIAVQPYDLDSVFLSKTVVTLRDVFANAVHTSFDLSPLPTTNQTSSPTSATTDVGAAHAVGSSVCSNASPLPFSSGSQPYVTSSRRDASPNTSVGALQEYTNAVRGADVPPMPAQNLTAPWPAPSSSQPQAAPPQLLVVPLDAYHFLLSFNGIDVAGNIDGAAHEPKSRDTDDFAAVVRRTTSTAEKISAEAPGCRPPRSGIAVVRRVEGEMGSAASTNTDVVHPTVSRLAEHLPLESVGGWVRDYTVYGLSRNAAVLREAWADKVREREAGVVKEQGAVEEGQEGVARAPVRGAVVEVCADPDAKHLSAVVGGAEASHSPSQDAPHVNPATGNTNPAVSSPAVLTGDADRDDGKEDNDDDHGNASGTLVEPEIAIPVLGAAAAAEDKEGDTVKATTAAMAAATVSPSLERLNCSSTTAASSPSSPFLDAAGDGHPFHASVEATPEQHATQAAHTCPPPPEGLWSEERRREAHASAQLAHRLVVSDAAHHAIWALEVFLPAMDVRVVAPAEFYCLEDDEEEEEKKEENYTSQKTATLERCESTEEAESAETPAGQMPRRKPATEVTQSRTRTSSPTIARAVAQANRPRSPSPVEPQPAAETHTNGGSLPHGADAATARAPPQDASPSPSHSRRTRRGQSSKSASPSVALAEAVPTPLMGGARGFVDGHFSVARFNAPGALCWRVDEAVEGLAAETEPLDVGQAPNTGAFKRRRAAQDPLSYLQKRRRCSVLFISDVGNCAIRYANFHNRLVRTIAGMDGVPGYRDGSCVSSLLRGATALAWCSAGLLFTDGPNNVVRLITHVNKPQQPAPTRQTVTQERTTDSEEASTQQQSTEAQAAKTEPVSEATTLPAHSAPPADAGEVLDALLGGSPASHPAAPLTQAPAASPGPSEARVAEEPTIDSNTSLQSTRNVVPRVWTLAGCVDGSDAMLLPDSGCTSAAAVASYVDCNTPSRARFGYLSDMALRVDETGNTHLFLLDQTHHAVRILDGEGGGVSTYVGPLDYAAAAAATESNEYPNLERGAAAAAGGLPPGLTYPTSLALCALIKERSPALLDSASPEGGSRASMLSPQPYLYSSTPMLFVASALTGAVSVMLPISQRSDLAPWNAAATPTQPPAASSAATSATLQRIRSAMTLGIATEGRRSVGEATAPSLKHVVVGWAAEDDSDAAQIHHALQDASLQQALLYLRLRFPWVLPPTVPQLNPRLVACCTCHVSGKRRGTSAQRRPSTSFARDHNTTAGKTVGVSLLPRSSRSLSNGRRGSGDARRAHSPLPSPTRQPVQPQRLLFHTPPRHPVTTGLLYTQALRDPRTAAAAREVAGLISFPSASTAALSVPHVVEVREADLAKAPDDQRQSTSPDALSVSAHSRGGSSSPQPAHDNDEVASATPADEENVDVNGNEREVGRPQTQTRSGALPKWLPPPTKSLSRSPVSTPRRAVDGEDTTPAGAASTSPSYAAKFQKLPAEQRQLRLLQTLDEEEEEEEATSLLPKKTQQTAEGDPREVRERDSASPLRSPPRQPRQHATPSCSPNNSSGRASPPLTPRAMAAHQLMQRRRTSRSNTAPHVPSVGSTRKAPSQDAVNTETAKEQRARVDGGRRSKEEGNNNEDEQQDRCRSASHTVHEVGDAPLPPSAGAMVTMAAAAAPAVVSTPTTLLPFHDTYDAAVRRLFRVYAFFATRTVTQAVAAGTRRLSRQVEHYSMPFSAFYRFLVLTGYGDFIADTAARAKETSSSGVTSGEATAVAAQVYGSKAAPALLNSIFLNWSAHLTQVQRRSAIVAASASREGSRTGTASTSSANRKARLSTNSPKAPLQSLPMLLPLATSDTRAVAEVLYSCGVRMQGYHVVTCMDFQSFRRAVLLLRTWAATAHRCSERKDDSDEVCGEDKCDAVLFSYLDHVPSLDALSAEDVVAAYSEVYAQAVRTVPALQTLRAETARIAKKEKQKHRDSESVDSREGLTTRLHADSDNEAPKRVANDAMVFDGNGSVDGCQDVESTGDVDEQLEEVGVGTPPVSPISLAKGGEDLSCLLDPSVASDTNGNDAHNSSFSGETVDDAAAVAPVYISSSLTLEERLALDDLLRLLQRNEGTLRELFEAYSVPVVVHRSANYKAPHSAAAAAAVSNPCSLIMNESRSLGASALIGDVSQEALVEKRTKMWGSAASSLRNTRASQQSSGRTATATGKSVIPAEAAHLREAAVVPPTQQDLWWKVQQLYTMSSLESREVFERTTHTVPVVPYRHFVELWRILDVFPALMTTTAVQHAYLDATTTVLLRGSGAVSRVTYASAPLHNDRKNGAVATKATAAAAHEKEVQELLFAHSGLPYSCFVESFVRVAMTVFSHEVDRVAYPTGAAKTAGLMQWCNKQILLGLVEQRTLKHLRNTAAIREGGKKSFGSAVGDGNVMGGSSRRGSNSAASLLATRPAQSSGMFPSHLRLFHVPAAQKAAQ